MKYRKITFRSKFFLAFFIKKTVLLFRQKLKNGKLIDNNLRKISMQAIMKKGNTNDKSFIYYFRL